MKCKSPWSPGPPCFIHNILTVCLTVYLPDILDIDSVTVNRSTCQGQAILFYINKVGTSGSQDSFGVGCIGICECDATKVGEWHEGVG